MDLISAFVLEESIAKVVLKKPLECHIHGKLDIVHMTPDLVSGFSAPCNKIND
jgi:hypothetical protein